MLSEELFTLWENHDFRLFVLTTARAHTDDDKMFKRLVAQAWGILSNGPPQKATEYYQAIARNAIAREYYRYKYGKLDKCDTLK